MSAGDGDAAPRVVSASQQLLALIPIRLALGLVGLALAVGLAPRRGPVALAFALGAMGTAVVLAADRRFALRALQEPAPLPKGARIASLLEAVGRGVVPSTVGVSVLAAVALGFNRTLAGLLAGIVAGMGLAALAGWYRVAAAERAEGVRVYVEQGRRKRLFTQSAR